jgi:hypothetical protein
MKSGKRRHKINFTITKQNRIPSQPKHEFNFRLLREEPQENVFTAETRRDLKRSRAA